MIYLTTFILSLFLSHIVCALPRGCDRLISPETETYQLGLTYDDTQYAQPSPLKATYDQTFDNPGGSVMGVACSDGLNGLAKTYPTFGNLPHFPYIGGAYDIVWNSTNCGSCWRITNTANNAIVFVTAIDTAGHGFNIATKAFKKLNDGQLGNALVVNAVKVSPYPC